MFKSLPRNLANVLNRADHKDGKGKGKDRGKGKGSAGGDGAHTSFVAGSPADTVAGVSGHSVVEITSEADTLQGDGRIPPTHAPSGLGRTSPAAEGAVGRITVSLAGVSAAHQSAPHTERDMSDEHLSVDPSALPALRPSASGNYYATNPSSLQQLAAGMGLEPQGGHFQGDMRGSGAAVGAASLYGRRRSHDTGGLTRHSLELAAHRAEVAARTQRGGAGGAGGGSNGAGRAQSSGQARRGLEVGGWGGGCEGRRW